MSITRLGRVVVVVAAGCQAATSSPPDGAPSADVVPLDVALARAGATVQHGQLEMPDLSSCCSGDQSCSGTNPSSPYGRLRLPPGIGQTVANPNADPDGTATAWRLRQDEAVIVVGTTPPSARYYGFTPYLADRYDATLGYRTPLFASLGDTWNQLVMTTGGPTPFASSFAIVVASNASTAQLVQRKLLRAGVPASEVNVVVLPSSTVRLGLDDEADTFSFYLRVAIPDDPAALDAWFATPPAVYRVTPDTEVPDNPLAAPAARTRGTGVTEDLSLAVTALGQAILANLGGTPIATTNADPASFNGDVCIQNDRFCGGDNRDALYGGSAGTFDLDQPGRYVMVYGVNHAATGKASYSNATIVYKANSLGVVSVDSTMMPGSAAIFVPDDPQSASLYAYAFARDCSAVPTPYCVTVPSDGCPLLPTGEAANITFRAYLEPPTTTGPALGELEVDRVLLVN